MDCTIILSRNGKNVTKTLNRTWRNKFAIAFKHDFGDGQQRMRIVVEVKDQAISGFIQIDQDKIGLPLKKLARKISGLSTSWPPANGIAVEVMVDSGTQPQIIRPKIKPQDGSGQSHDPHPAKQWWGVFKNSPGCKCATLGPATTKPATPAGFSIYGYYNNQDAASRAQARCEKSLPRECFNTDRQFWGVFKDLTNCLCPKIGPSPLRPAVPNGMTLYDYYTNEINADNAVTKCHQSLPTSCGGDDGSNSSRGNSTVNTSPSGVINGAVDINIIVGGTLTTPGQLITIPLTIKFIGRISGMLAYPDKTKYITATFSIFSSQIEGTITYTDEVNGISGKVRLLSKVADYAGIDENGGSVYKVTWHNHEIGGSAPGFGVFDVNLTTSTSF